ncbi:response regulator [Geomonas limicola]|uniref:Response regulator n=1 Tax=Geomonas limicola TaxID=2740186 RepID=A0A6V8NFC3_9BACT|nr:response regulator [Geomonas limicola]
MKRRVLIVDDTADIRLMLRYLIERENYEIVAEASDGVEAVEMFFECRPDITIMDVDLPFKSGVQAAREILSRNGEARIIFCSGTAKHQELSGLGAAGELPRFIRKPFLPAQLYSAMDMQC